MECLFQAQLVYKVLCRLHPILFFFFFFFICCTFYYHTIIIITIIQFYLLFHNFSASAAESLRVDRGSTILYHGLIHYHHLRAPETAVRRQESSEDDLSKNPQKLRAASKRKAARSHADDFEIYISIRDNHHDGFRSSHDGADGDDDAARDGTAGEERRVGATRHAARRDQSKHRQDKNTHRPGRQQGRRHGEPHRRVGENIGGRGRPPHAGEQVPAVREVWP